MYIRITDGKAVFATHLIKGDFSHIAHDDMGKNGLWLEVEGIPIYYGNLSAAETFIHGFNIPYMVEVLDYEVHKPKAQGTIYRSREEAINHLLYDAEPASQVIPNMKKKLADKDKEIAEMKQKYADLEGRMKKLEGKQTPI